MVVSGNSKPRPAGNGAGRALRALLAALVGAWGAATGAIASDHDDHERARRAVQAGEVLPLPTLLERLQRAYPGQVLELELERDDGRWIYEVKLLRSDGQLLKLELDAATGKLLQIKRARAGRADTSKEAPR